MKPHALLLALALPSVSSAHFLWAKLDPAAKNLAIGLGEIPTDEPSPLKERAGLVKAWEPGKPLALAVQGAWLTAPTAADRVGVSVDYGVLDKREEGRGLFWLNYCAKAALTPEASQAKLDLAVELSVVVEGGKSVVTVRHHGKPAKGAAIVAELSNGKYPFKGETGADGTVALDVAQGALAVRALVVENVKGEAAGKTYDLRRTYGTLTVNDLSAKPPSRRAMALAKADPKAYALLEKASLARQTMPKDVKEIAGSVEFVQDGKSVKAPFVFRPGSRATVDKTGLSLVAGAEVEGQVASLFSHRQSVPFAEGNGKYDLKLVSEDETGALIAVGDENGSTMRVRGDELVEVTRTMHGNRFVVSTLENVRTDEGKSLPKIYTVTYFDPATGALTKAQAFTDAYTKVNGVWLPLTRQIQTAKDGRIQTVALRFSELRVVRG